MLKRKIATIYMASFSMTKSLKICSDGAVDLSQTQLTDGKKNEQDWCHQ